MAWPVTVQYFKSFKLSYPLSTEILLMVPAEMVDYFLLFLFFFFFLMLAMLAMVAANMGDGVSDGERGE